MNKNDIWDNEDQIQLVAEGFAAAAVSSVFNCFISKSDGSIQTPIDGSEGSSMFVGFPIGEEGIDFNDPAGLINTFDGLHVIGVNENKDVKSIGCCGNAILIGNGKKPTGIYIPLGSDEAIELFPSNVDFINTVRSQFIDHGKEVFTTGFDIISNKVFRGIDNE